MQHMSLSVELGGEIELYCIVTDFLQLVSHHTAPENFFKMKTLNTTEIAVDSAVITIIIFAD